MTGGRPKLRKALKLALLAGFYLCLILGGRWLERVIEDSLQVSSLGQAGMPVVGTVIAILLIYIALTAIPFVPGTEIGLALLMVFGAQVAGIVYLSTFSALVLAFAVGRLVPDQRLAAWLLRHDFTRTAGLIETFYGLSPVERDHYLTQNAPRRLVPWLTRHRAHHADRADQSARQHAAGRWRRHCAGNGVEQADAGEAVPDLGGDCRRTGAGGDHVHGLDHAVVRSPPIVFARSRES